MNFNQSIHFKLQIRQGTKAARHDVPWPKEFIKSRSALRYLENKATKIRWLFKEIVNVTCHVTNVVGVLIRSNLKGLCQWTVQQMAVQFQSHSIILSDVFLISPILMFYSIQDIFRQLSLYLNFPHFITRTLAHCSTSWGFSKRRVASKPAAEITPWPWLSKGLCIQILKKLPFFSEEENTEILFLTSNNEKIVE